MSITLAAIFLAATAARPHSSDAPPPGLPAEAAILLAANIGGDSDSVASIAGGILGARCPSTVNERWYAVVQQVNDFDLVAIANQLAALRH